MRRAFLAAAALAATLLLLPLGAGAATKPLDPGTQFYVPLPSSAALRQTLTLAAHGQFSDALKLGSMLAQSHAVWFTKGTPAQVQQDVRKTMVLAAVQHRTPILVAYDI